MKVATIIIFLLGLPFLVVDYGKQTFNNFSNYRYCVANNLDCKCYDSNVSSIGSFPDCYKIIFPNEFEKYSEADLRFLFNYISVAITFIISLGATIIIWVVAIKDFYKNKSVNKPKNNKL